MSSSTLDTIRLVVTADSVGAQRALAQFGDSVKKTDTLMGGFRRGLSLGSGQAITMRDRLGLLGQGFTKLKTGGLAGASGAAQNFGTALSGIGKYALGAVAGLGAAAGAISLVASALTKVVTNGATYLGQIAKLGGVTGMAGQDALIWWNRMSMVGVAADDGARALTMFAKSMYAARTEGSPLAQTFAKLGVNLKDANGRWRSQASVLGEVRSKMSLMTDSTARMGIGMELFKKSFSAVRVMFTRTNAEIAKYDQLIKDAKLHISDADIAALKQYTTNMRSLAQRQALVSINSTNKLMPALNAMASIMDYISKLMASIIDKLTKMAKIDMGLPGFKQIEGAGKWILGGIPGLANEGIVKARPGGTIVRLAEAGQDEVVLKRSRLLSAGAVHRTTNHNYNLTVQIQNVIGTDERAARNLWNTIKPIAMSDMRMKMAMSRG